MAVQTSRSSLLFCAPAAIQGAEVLAHLRRQVLALDASGQADGGAHLLEVLAAVLAGGEMRLEAPTLRSRQHALQIVGDQLDHLLADEPLLVPEHPHTTPNSDSRA